jgi:hypothetical protein
MDRGITPIGEIEFMEKPGILKRLFKPNLNKLFNYISFTKGITQKQEFLKVEEEIKEFRHEVVKGDRDKQVAEGLDVITAMINYLSMLGLDNDDFKKHINKLNKYKRSGKYGN